MAIKWNDDEYYKNEYYAKVGGITVVDINTLEAEFLQLIDYRLYVDTSVFNSYTEKIIQYLNV